jgi:hypothetical protein
MIRDYMTVEEYQGFNILVYYRGKTTYYRVWTKDFDDISPGMFRSIKSARKYINEELV